MHSSQPPPALALPMEIPATILSPSFLPSHPSSLQRNPNTHLSTSLVRTKRPQAPWRIRAVEGATDLAPPEVSWQVIVGAVAGVTPFVVAGIEFGKRIAAQRRCKICEGSGLVLKNKKYRRCPGCGGFLPWQSWQRFFTG